MKDEIEVEDFLMQIDVLDVKYPSMTYEQGLEAALMWVLGEVEDRSDIYRDQS